MQVKGAVPALNTQAGAKRLPVEEKMKLLLNLWTISGRESTAREQMLSQIREDEHLTSNEWCPS